MNFIWMITSINVSSTMKNKLISVFPVYRVIIENVTGTFHPNINENIPSRLFRSCSHGVNLLCHQNTNAYLCILIQCHFQTMKNIYLTQKHYMDTGFYSVTDNPIVDILAIHTLIVYQFGRA